MTQNNSHPGFISIKNRDYFQSFLIYKEFLRIDHSLKLVILELEKYSYPKRV